MPGNPQMSREELQAFLEQLRGGRDAFGSTGNYYSGVGGTIDPNKVDPFYRDQMEYGNVDDAGNGIWNYRGGQISLRDGRTGFTQLGNNGATRAHEEVVDPNKVEYDDELGLVTPWDNILQREDKGMGHFRTGVLSLIGAGAGAGLYGMYGAAGAGGADLAGVGADLAGLGGDAALGSSGAALGGSGIEGAGLMTGLTPSGASGAGLLDAPYFGLGDAGGGLGLDAIQAGENVGSMTPMNPTNTASYPNTPWGNTQLELHNIGAGNPGNMVDRFTSGVMDDPLRTLRAGNSIMSMFGGAGDQGGGGDEGPTELGDMGWRPPTSNPDAEWMYGPDEQFDSWRDQYNRSTMPLSELRRMYG